MTEIIVWIPDTLVQVAIYVLYVSLVALSSIFVTLSAIVIHEGWLKILRNNLNIWKKTAYAIDNRDDFIKYCEAGKWKLNEQIKIRFKKEVKK